MVYLVGGALLVGLSLGVFGSGGSILTVPVLVYLLGHGEKVAIAESLAIVGAIAALGVIPYARAGSLDARSVVFFGIPGMAGTYVGAALSRFVPGTAQLAVFALVLLGAAWAMFRQPSEATEREPRAFWKLGIEGLGVGVLTGFVGVGGGFLIVPALVVLGRLPIRLAIGTSLAVIALKSFTGFLKYLAVLGADGLRVNWPTNRGVRCRGVRRHPVRR